MSKQNVLEFKRDINIQWDEMGDLELQLSYVKSYFLASLKYMLLLHF